MNKLSVIISGVSDDKRFINKLLSETGNEIAVEIKDNILEFDNIDNKNIKAISKIIAKSIINEFEKKILLKVINKNCNYFTKPDKVEIWKKSMHELIESEFLENSEYIYRLNLISSELEKYYKTSNILSLEGFVNFRLGEYIKDLEEIVEFSVQDYLVDLEYREFINMLKYFVSMQTSKYLSVDVFLNDNIVTLFADGKDVTEECKAEFISEQDYNVEKIDDFILNSLIVISPKRIVIHNGMTDLTHELKMTITGVFADKVKYCSGCCKCQKGK